MTIKLTLPMPPSVNATYKVGKSRVGKAVFYKDKGASNWTNLCLTLIRRDLGPPALNPLIFCSVTVRLFGLGKAGDIDNRIKALGDLLQKAAIVKNDSGILEWHIYKAQVTGDSYITVEIDGLR